MNIKRILVYVIGLFILSLGVAFSILSTLGVSPISSVAYVLHNVTGLTVGTVTILEFSTYVLVQIILLRNNFKAISFIQVLFGTVFGLFVDLSLLLTISLTTSNIVVQVLYLLISIILIGVGLLFILTADIVPNAPEGLMLAIQKVTNFKFGNIKTVFDTTCVVFSSVIALIFLAKFSDSGIGLGTFATALLVGKVLGFLMDRYRNPLLKFIGR